MEASQAPALATAMVLLAAWPLTPYATQPPQPAHAAVARVHTVVIDGMRFRPRVVVVRRGDKITWINKDPFPHTVTASGGKFDSRQIAPEGSWTYVARDRGKYDYVCTLHVTMKGRVEVR